MTDINRAAQPLTGTRDAEGRRQTNPFGIWARCTGLPLPTPAIHARRWIGFPVARVTPGERLCPARNRRDIASHHVRAAHGPTTPSALGMAPHASGPTMQKPLASPAGPVATILPKVLLCARMVAIHADRTGATPCTGLSARHLPPDRSPA